MSTEQGAGRVAGPVVAGIGSRFIFWCALALAVVGLLAACAVRPPGGTAQPAPTGTAAEASTGTPPAAGATAPTTTSAAAAATTPTTVAKPKPRTVTILGSGDVLIHPELWEQAQADAKSEGESGIDFGPMYASIAPDVRRAQVAICEMESPLAPPDGPFTGWPNFSSPPQVLTALTAVGYNVCTTASNHSIDEGYEGVVRTLGELDAAGIKHTGSARSAKEAATPLMVTTESGVKVAMLAYSFGFNGNQLPADQPWLANETDVPTILAAAHRAKKAGADIVVLSMHWGIEYEHDATAEQQDEANALLASPDIDLILGDHTHVVQPAQKINGKWVFYGMGNQISRHADPIPEGRQGIMPMVTFTETASGKFKVSDAEAIATWMQDTPALRLIDIHLALADPATSPAKRAEFQTAHDAIVKYLDGYGATAHGLRVI
ncbi:MAG: CapA family protein [Actinomycetia bacterium]|nr:CapA family protein [Actinomycetes bacterium]